MDTLPSEIQLSVMNAGTPADQTMWSYVSRDMRQVSLTNVISNDDALSSAAKSAELERLKVLVSYGYKITTNTLNAAARSGNIQVVRYCLDMGASSNYHTLILAIEYGTIEMVTLLHSDIFMFTSKVAATAAKCGKLNVLQWLIATGYKWDKDVCIKAAKYGHFDCLQWALDNGCQWNSYAISVAAKYGHLDVVLWCLQSYKADVDVIDYAVLSCNVGLVQLLRFLGYCWSESTCVGIIERGNLAMLEWCVERGCPMTDMAYAMAVEKKRLEICKWLLEYSNEKGLECKWPVDTCEQVKDDKELLSWCVKNRLPGY